MTKNQRKLINFLINPKYQLKYVFWTTLTGLTLIASYLLGFYWVMKKNYDSLLKLSPMDEYAQAQLYTELTQILLALLLFSVLYLLVLTMIGIILSHRTAGPMYHFRRVFNQIAQGKTTTRIHLRPSDDFKEVAQDFNQLMDKISGPNQSL